MKIYHIVNKINISSASIISITLPLGKGHHEKPSEDCLLKNWSQDTSDSQKTCGADSYKGGKKQIH